MDAPVSRLVARAYTIPTDRPEADGTLAWDSTTLVVAEIDAAGQRGLGYTYGSAAVAKLIRVHFAELLVGQSAFDIPACFHRMLHTARNLGTVGQVSYAIAAVDTALWDLKARLLDVSLADLMGEAAPAVRLYGSGGFTTYDDRAIRSQIDTWRAQGIMRAKIKIGSNPSQDLQRVKTASTALGPDGHLFVDANGAYSAKQALDFAERFREHDVRWFEEPVSSDNLADLHLIRDRAPAGMDITAGEYADSLFYVRRMLDAGAVDVMQIDVTRCQGYSGFLHAASLALAANVPISSHCAPALHLPVCCHMPHLRHMEYFYDHARIERMLFDGVVDVVDGCLTPDRSRPGHGLTLKEADAEPFAA
jgi:L-alanine-DL-glutamate epimerase-like enolase superfamily enzyme